MAVREVNLAVPPERIAPVMPGDTIRVITEFDYIGPKLDLARMITAIWYPSLLDPHNEIVRGEKVFNIPDSPPPGQHLSVVIDLLVPPADWRDDYGLYSSIRDVPGADIYTPYYPNLITIMGEPLFSNLKITSYTKR